MPDRARAAVDLPLQADVSMAEACLCAPIDANGNLTSDGTRSFEWDARHQLVAVTVGTHRSEFSYDGLQRRVRQIEKDNGVTTADTRVLWCETAICEERAADGVTVTRRAFGLGEQIGGQARFFTTDHLGSVREVTDTAGTLLARYGFDPWGRRTVTAGTDVTTIGFTGHRTHTTSGLTLALYRGYEGGLARWVSEDPTRLKGGLNLYAYVGGRVTTSWDPLGLRGAAAGGASCCKELQQRRQRVHDIMDGNASGAGVDSPGPYAVETCSEAGGDYSVMPHTPPCLVECVKAHEQRHMTQCRRFGPSYMATPAAERAAYMVELGCVIRKIRQLGCECS